MTDVIIIGAGAAGLMAAKLLAEAGLSVQIVEARERLGGRIHSFDTAQQDTYEGGAEFIHGNLETTLEVLEEAGIDKQELTGEMWNVKDEKWRQENDLFERADEVIGKLKQLEQDISIETFVHTFFGEEKDTQLRSSIRSYIEGYYSGEISKMSAQSFLHEWLSEDDQQYRPVGGY